MERRSGAITGGLSGRGSIEGEPEEKETLSAFLAGLAEREGETPAFIYGQKSLSFARLERVSRRVAGGLERLGVGPGDRVALWLPDHPAWMVLYFACVRLGAIAVCANTRYRSAEIGDLIARSGAKFLAFWQGFKGIDFARILEAADRDALRGLEAVLVHNEREAAPGSVLGRPTLGTADLEAGPSFDDDLAEPRSGSVIFTTSGTTKAPKLVLHSHRSIIRHARSVASAFGYGEEGSRMLQLVPFCGVFGFSQAMAALAAGSPSVLLPAFNADEAARLAKRHAVTHLIGTDQMFRRILAACKEPRPFPKLRFAGFASFNPMITDLLEEGERKGVRFIGLYGSSEAQALFAAQPVEAPPGRRGLAGGLPVSPEARVRACDPESGLPLPHGQTGALELLGPSLMTAYFGDEGSTKAAFTDDGYFKTGDLGYTEPDGGFVFLSRAGEFLRLGGYLVNPKEIEDYIREHPFIEDCQVVGVARPEGTRAVAFVTSSPDRFDESELRAHCRKGLAKYKLPERFVRLEAFPTTHSPNGPKVQRQKLREMAEALYENAPFTKTRPWAASFSR